MLPAAFLPIIFSKCVLYEEHVRSKALGSTVGRSVAMAGESLLLCLFLSVFAFIFIHVEVRLSMDNSQDLVTTSRNILLW